jgi:hypothetical protein
MAAKAPSIVFVAGQDFAMRLVWKIFAVLVVGTALGLLAVWLAVFRGSSEMVSNGPWKADPTAGSAQSDAYRRALVAVHGLFALTRNEAAYYTAATDSDGQALDGGCRYEIMGHALDARWWSITAYGADDYLIANPAHRYSVTGTTVTRDANGGFVMQVGGTAGGDSWIPVGSGRFSLTLRLYNPGPAILFDPTHVVLPALKRASCP